MKLCIRSITVLALSMAACFTAAAAPIFSDDFQRTDTNVVGNGWSEVEPQPSDIRVHGGVLELQDTGSHVLQASGLSTLGFGAITLAYDWALMGNTETPDELALEWRDGSQSGPWTLLALHSLAGTGGSFTSESIALGIAAANLSDLQFRFRLGVDGNNEGVLLDNIVLSGAALAGPQPLPEPGGLALAGLSLTLLAFTRRAKRKARRQ